MSTLDDRRRAPHDVMLSAAELSADPDTAGPARPPAAGRGGQIPRRPRPPGSPAPRPPRLTPPPRGRAGAPGPGGPPPPAAGGRGPQAPARPALGGLRARAQPPHPVPEGRTSHAVRSEAAHPVDRGAERSATSVS